MKRPLFIVLSVVFFAGSAAGQQKFQPTGNAGRQAVARGQGGEFLATMEALGSEAEKRERWAEASQAYGQASITAQRLGQLQKTISYASKALELAQRAKDIWLQVKAMQRLAGAYASLGQFEKEREWVQKGLEVSKQLTGDRKNNIEAILYGQLGENFLQQGEAQKAIEYISNAVQALDSQLNYYKRIRRSLRNPQQLIGLEESLLVTHLARLGSAYLRAGNGQEAMKAFERGMATVKTSGLDIPAEGRLSNGLGRAYLAQKDYLRALENFTKALQMAEARRQAGQIQNASRGIADVFLQTGKPLEAIPYYKKAIDGIESTRSLLESEELRISFFENKGHIYGAIVLAYLRAKNIEEAFNYNERARSRAFLDILGSKVQLARSGTMIEQERALQARISVLRAMMGAQEGDAAQTAELRKQLSEAQQAYNEYLTNVRKENKEQASLMNVEPLTLKQVQELLDPGVTMLEYFVSNNMLWLWVVEKDRVQFVSSAIARKDLVSKATQLRDTIYQFSEKERFSALSQELYALLVQPALPHIHGKELIIVPHDVLHYLPFQALLSSQGKYLIQDYPIYYLSSASLLQFTKEKRRADKGDKVLALGNPDLGDPKMNLQFAELEAKEIQGLYPQSTVLLKRDATEDKAKELSPQNDMIHFASHAELSENDPLSSAVLLAKSDKEDGRLEVREIFGMDLKASLVVLSACETGLGKLSSGDELVGLTRAFIYAGTPSVVASLWNVEDSSTAALMASFYKNLKTMTKVEALRQAQLELIRGEGRSDLFARRGVGGIGKLGEVPRPETSSLGSVSTAHPYFWAPFILVGDGK